MAYCLYFDQIDLFWNQFNQQEKQKEKVDQVSHPLSINYGKYASSKEIIEKTSPSNENIEKVIQWISLATNIQVKYELDNVKKTGYLPLILTVQQAESLLECEFHYYFHLSSNKLVSRAQTYHIPQELANVISFIGAGWTFFMFL